jgi:hypothetical protein
MHSRFTPTCFSKSLTSSGGRSTSAADGNDLLKHVVVNLECFNNSYCFLNVFVGSSVTTTQYSVYSYEWELQLLPYVEKILRTVLINFLLND